MPPIAAVVTLYYGASGKYVVRTGLNGSIACNNTTFGDPNVGVAKSCSYVVTGSLASNTGKGLQGQYFATNDLSGSVVLQRTEAVNFNWGSGSPGTAVPSDNFSVRWSGLIEAPSTGNYTFQTNSDDGIRVWVNGALIINNWDGPFCDAQYERHRVAHGQSALHHHGGIPGVHRQCTGPALVACAVLVVLCECAQHPALRTLTLRWHAGLGACRPGPGMQWAMIVADEALCCGCGCSIPACHNPAKELWSMVAFFSGRQGQVSQAASQCRPPVAGGGTRA